MSLPPPAPGHVAIVTGASSGIGSDIARELGFYDARAMRRSLDVEPG